MKPYVDISFEALSDFLTPGDPDRWMRCTKGIQPKTQIVGITLQERIGCVRLHLDRDADEPTFVAEHRAR